ncbi:hypothetical protein SCLCIDRAFT_1206978, partial [Scleroderma citrinum Foug A]
MGATSAPPSTRQSAIVTLTRSTEDALAEVYPMAALQVRPTLNQGMADELVVCTLDKVTKCL